MAVVGGGPPSGPDPKTSILSMLQNPNSSVYRVLNVNTMQLGGKPAAHFDYYVYAYGIPQSPKQKLNIMLVSGVGIMVKNNLLITYEWYPDNSASVPNYLQDIQTMITSIAEN